MKKTATAAATTAAAASSAVPRLFDTHCHIGLIRRDRDRVPSAAKAIGSLSAKLAWDATTKCQAAFAANVQRLMIVGIDDVTSKQAAEVSQVVLEEAKYLVATGQPGSVLAAPNVPTSAWSGYSAGIHPHCAQDLDKMWPTIEGLARDGIKTANGALVKPVAIGETGLDYFKSTADPVQQKKCLKAHVMLALELDLPIIIHCREAYADLWTCLEEWGVKKIKGVLHCFASDVKDMMRGVEFGFKVSFCGTLTYPKSHDLREACAACPANSIVLETDAPFLPPQGKRGEVNVPVNVTAVAEMAAKLRNEDPVALADQAWRNSCELFQIPM